MRAPSCCHGRVRVTATALTALTAALLLLVPAVEAQLLHEKGPGYGRTLRPALPVTAASPPAWSVGNPRCSAGAVDGFTTSHAWMSRLPDGTKIFLDLSIPGTHGSASYVFKDGSNFQSQSNTITQQLEAGIRFLDMPLAFIRSTMYVAYNRQPVVSEVVTFQDAMQQVTSFLDKNPREVVLIRVGRTDVAMNFPQYKWSDDLAIAEFNRHVPLSKYRDRACTQQNCKLGPSRGRIIFIDHQLRVRKLTLLRYEDVMMIQWHNTVLETRPQLDERWHQLRSALELASMTRTPLAGTPESRAGMITFFSAFRTGGHGKDPHPIPPFFAASGQVHHGEDERRRLVEVAEKFGTDRYCQAPIGSPPYPDFPRVDCKGCGKETMCEIAFEGMNRLLYTWLRRGLTGQQQSCHLQSKNVYPRYLGILVLDFPDNSLIDIIVSLNFLHPDRYKEPAFKTQSRGVRPFACTQNYCAASGALSADAYVQTVNRGRIVAGKVVEGDELHAGLLEADAGAEGAPPKTCRVIAVNTEGNRFDPTTTLNGVVGSALVTATRNSASRMSPPGNLHLMGSGPWMSPAWPGFFDSIAAPAGVLMEGETSSRIVVVEHGRVVNHMPREQVSVQKPQKLVTIVTECGAIASPVSGNTKDVSSTGGVTPFPALLWRLPFTSVPSE